MREVEILIAEWRKKLIGKIPPERSEEIEEHLRELIDERTRKGMSEKSAFDAALKMLGSTEAISAEFEKLEPPLWWPARIAIAVAAVAALLLPALLLIRFQNRPAEFPWANYVLGIHVYAVTLGYSATFLLGALGICYVCQRSFGDLSPGRVRSLSKLCFEFSVIAAVLTGIGIVLGMIWTAGAWGRIWNWDAKETGGLATFIGLLTIAICSRRKTVSTHTLMLMTLLQNIIVATAWFAPNLTGAHGDRTATYSMLALTTVTSIVFVLLGFAPAGWLKLRKAR
jgi:hypothetical protein